MERRVELITLMSADLPLVYLVRHGETAWSLSGQATGRTDIALTEQGERDARGLRARLQGLSFAGVFTSPLQRARHTAELAGFGERAELDADLAEWDYGAYEGRRTAEILAERPGWRLIDDGCPGGETLATVSLRADGVIGRIRALKGDALVFAHRDIMRIVAARWLGLNAVEARRLYLDTASVSILGYHHNLDEPVIRLWNDAPPCETKQKTPDQRAHESAAASAGASVVSATGPIVTAVANRALRGPSWAP